ncbi:Hypothetical protein SRAE_X000031700 [Strongyloides ratti]|uniref:Uncharacterized protein n=1 Tax=Strongyloides ratti TaxID=34506 RepID=A0A090LTM4_STRRB|nr:Hypothetical protein SRAE_X000031700 [Strongyloides ratti]CEF70989.1 Hypothetical protein SRAE_X000031700 [Strongyloides ratti]
MFLKNIKKYLILLFLIQLFGETQQDNNNYTSFLRNDATINPNYIVEKVFAYKRRKNLPTFVDDMIMNEKPFYYKNDKINKYKNINTYDRMNTIKIDLTKRSSNKNFFLFRKDLKFHPFDFDTLGGLGLGKRTI